MPTLLDCQRDLFEIPDHVTYLNCAYMSPSLKAVRHVGEAGARIKSEPWRIEPSHFFEGPDIARGLFARLIGAQADDIAIVPAVSYGMAIAAANLPVTQGDEIVVLENQFPANVYPWRDKADATGARIVTVPASHNAGWTQGILDAIGARTRIVALPHCHWTDGSLIDLEAVSRKARAQGAALVLDLAQSAGALPIDVTRIDPDFLVAPCYKWLLGPYSMGFAYIAPRHQNGRPVEMTWTGRQGAEDFANLVQYQDAYDTGARRFDMGERAQFHTLPMAIRALAQLLDWGPDTIAHTLGHLTDEIAERARALGLRTAPAETRARHFIGVRFPRGLPGGLLDALKARHIYVSVRGDSMRITPHLYNDRTDIDRLFSTLKDLGV